MNHYCPEFSERTGPKCLAHNVFSAILGGVGLKLVAICPSLFEGGPAHERRKDAVLAVDGLPTLEHIHADRGAVSWRPLGANFPLHRAIPGHGIRAADLPRKLARYRGMPVGSTREAFAHGLSRTGPAIDPRLRRGRLLADANEVRDWRIYAEFAQRLIAQARRLYAGESLLGDLDSTVYALDSTTMDLCLSFGGEKVDWTQDSVDELTTNLAIIHQNLDIISVHIYPGQERGRFGSPKPVDLLRVIKKAADELAKPLFVGEFGNENIKTAGPGSFVDRALDEIANLRVPYSALWVWEFYQRKPYLSYDNVATLPNLEPGYTDRVLAHLTQTNEKFGVFPPAHDTTPPLVVITWPLDCRPCTGDVPVQAVASAASGKVDRVEFWLDDKKVGGAPYSTILHFEGLSGGNHSLVAKVYDTSGNVGEYRTVLRAADTTGGENARSGERRRWDIARIIFVARQRIVERLWRSVRYEEVCLRAASGQRCFLGSALLPLQGEPAGVRSFERRSEVLVAGADGPARAVYIFALASDNPVEGAATSIYIHSPDGDGPARRITAMQAELQQARAALAATDDRLAALAPDEPGVTAPRPGIAQGAEAAARTPSSAGVERSRPLHRRMRDGDVAVPQGRAVASVRQPLSEAEGGTGGCGGTCAHESESELRLWQLSG